MTTFSSISTASVNKFNVGTRGQVVMMPRSTGPRINIAVVNAPTPLPTIQQPITAQSSELDQSSAIIVTMNKAGASKPKPQMVRAPCGCEVTIPPYVPNWAALGTGDTARSNSDSSSSSSATKSNPSERLLRSFDNWDDSDSEKQQERERKGPAIGVDNSMMRLSYESLATTRSACIQPQTSGYIKQITSNTSVTPTSGPSSIDSPGGGTKYENGDHKVPHPNTSTHYAHSTVLPLHHDDMVEYFRLAHEEHDKGLDHHPSALMPDDVLSLMSQTSPMRTPTQADVGGYDHHDREEQSEESSKSRSSSSSSSSKSDRFSTPPTDMHKPTSKRTKPIQQQPTTGTHYDPIFKTSSHNKPLL